MQFKDDVTIVLCGEAGQGIQTVEHLLSRLFISSGFNVYATKEYMSRVRGGSNSTALRISSLSVRAYCERIDILLPLDSEAITHLAARIKSETVIIGDKASLKTSLPVVDVPLAKLSAEIGGAIYANIIAVGVIAGLFKIVLSEAESLIKSSFAKKPDTIPKNLEALRRGFALGADMAKQGTLSISLTPLASVKNEILLSGAEAIAVGALAGGCDFISAYPMTPSTGIFTFIAQHAEAFGVVSEQAEDEIAAINMAIASWYAGARGMVATAGGGFALMVEGISLSGMLETPVVVALGQRPAPATGLPTRTEQGDLELALYAGHGDFPRAIFAPGTIEQAIELSQHAFNIADKYQSPAFILFDQYFADSYYNFPSPDFSKFVIQKLVTKTTPDYQRYKFTADGVSPRGIPGNGDGLVLADSDEHDETGQITEDQSMRTQMVDKRMKKYDGLLADAIAPTLTGPADYKKLVICWGSTLPMVEEAVKSSGAKDTAILHFSQVWPIHRGAEAIIKRAASVVIVENNYSSQFAKLLKLQFGIDIEKKILKYNGLPFSVEEISRKIAE
jgi:2-oxoglutarate ferredoxin oxidoreductase subunit alpha